MIHPIVVVRRSYAFKFRPTAVVASVLCLFAATVQAGIGASFQGTSQYDNAALAARNNFIPPDTMGAVGTTQFMEGTNGSYAVFDKFGALLQRITMKNFWDNAGQSGAPNGDQRILFDHFTNRWITIGFGASLSDINIGVSDTSNAMGTWKSTKFTGFAGGTADYPTLGMDQKGVYIGTNNFAPGFKGTSLFVIPKADLFGGAPTTANMTSFVTPLAGPDNGFAIQVAVNWGANPGNTASVMADSRIANNQVFYKLNGVNGPGATQTATTNIAGSAYANGPSPGRQPDGTRIIDTLDPRISANVMQSNGKLYSVTTLDGGNDHSVVRWSVNDANTGVIIAAGNIGDASFDYFQGSIAVNEFGQVVIGYNRSGFQTADLNGDGLADGNISFMARAYNSNGAGSLVQTNEYLLKVSTVNDYHNGSFQGEPAVGRQRWGDYSAVTLDPTDHQSFWAIGQFAREWNNAAGGHPGGSGGSRWGTWISDIQLAPVPEPETYALMFGGLLAMAAVVRRKKAAQV